MQNPALALAKFSKKSTADEAVRVVVRCRPLSSKEQNEGRTRVVDMDTKMGQVRGREKGRAGAGTVRRHLGCRACAYVWGGGAESR